MKLNLPVCLHFTPDEVLVCGFRTISGLPEITTENCTPKNIKKFKNHFGNTPAEIAYVWSDVLRTEIDLGLDPSDMSEKGFKKILTAIHFLWAYPKNNGLLSATCTTCKRLVEGENLWKYVKAIAKLKELVITWPETTYNDPLGQTFLGTVDGVDFKTREKTSEKFNKDPATMTHKHNHGGLKYEIMVDAYHPKIVWINGPFRGGVGDKTIFLSALAKKIPHGKLVVTDGVYSNKKDDNYQSMLSMPNMCDSKKLHNFKARLKSRHEGVNGKLVKYRALNTTYHHAHANHVYIFEAICCLVQYSMNHGSPIFDA